MFHRKLFDFLYPMVARSLVPSQETSERHCYRALLSRKRDSVRSRREANRWWVVFLQM